MDEVELIGQNLVDADINSIIQNAGSLNLEVDAEEVEEMLREEPLDFTTEELQVLTRSNERCAHVDIPDVGLLATMPAAKMKEGMADVAKATEFILPLVPDKVDEVKHLLKILDGIWGHACRTELKRREKQTTMDRFALLLFLFSFFS
jgi:hypothetical protein